MKKALGLILKSIFNAFGKDFYVFKAKGIYKIDIVNKSTDNDCYITIRQLLKHVEPTVFYDIGANQGSWSNVLLNECNSIQEIVLFEPQKQYKSDLESIKKQGVKTTIFPIGLGNQKFTTTIKGGGASASILQVNSDYAFANELTSEEEIIEVEMLDDFVKANNLPQPDLIKIDVQGLEYDIILGGLETIKQAKFLVIELSFDEFYQQQEPLFKILKTLDELNFKLADFGFEWRNNYNYNNRLLQIDGIFYNKNLVNLQ